jgi:hypothetical protein
VKNLQLLAKNKLVEDFDFSISEATRTGLCQPCLEGKHHRSSFPQCAERRMSEPLQLIHSDVCGKLNPMSLGGAEYFVTFIDDSTRYVWVYNLKKKSDVFECFRQWKSEVENHWNTV